MYASTDKEGTRKRHQVDTIVEGIGLNRLTENFNIAIQNKWIDDAISVTDQEAVAMSRYLLKSQGFQFIFYPLGIFIGSSSAVNCVAAAKVAQMMPSGSVIVTLLCDHGSRHLTKFWNQHVLEQMGLDPKDEKGLAFLANG